VANPDNITLRSEKGSYLTFEDMDLNLLELQNQINEYNQFLINEYNPLVDGFNVIRIGQVLIYSGNWSGSETYDKNEVIIYTDELFYISISNNNTEEPVTGVNTPYWIVFTAKAIAALTTFDDSGSEIITTDNVQDAIEQLSNAAVSDFKSPVYGSRGSAFTAVSNGWYSLDVSVSGFIVTLPVSPSDGDTIEFFLSLGDFSANNVTINRSGQTIEGLAENMLIDSNFPRGFVMMFNGTTWRIK